MIDIPLENSFVIFFMIAVIVEKSNFYSTEKILNSPENGLKWLYIGYINI